MPRALSASLPCMLLTASSALAATAPCTAGSATFECRLSSVLHLLYVVAAILALILVLCIVFAVRAYRRNRASDSRLPRS